MTVDFEEGGDGPITQHSFSRLTFPTFSTNTFHFRHLHSQKQLEKVRRKDRKEEVGLKQLEEILRRRHKSREMDFDVGPEIAAVVVQKYFIPMFEVENETIMDKKRAKLTGG